MSDPAHPPAAKAASGGMPSPGQILGILAAVGFGIYLLLTFLGMGVDAIGAAKRRYPEVIMGMIIIGLIAGAIFASKNEKK